MHILAATYSIASFSTVDRFQTALSIAYNDNTIPAQSFTIRYQPTAESIIVVLVALQFGGGRKGEEKIVQDLPWIPCGIMGGYVC